MPALLSATCRCLSRLHDHCGDDLVANFQPSMVRALSPETRGFDVIAIGGSMCIHLTISPSRGRNNIFVVSNRINAQPEAGRELFWKASGNKVHCAEFPSFEKGKQGLNGFMRVRFLF
jgi:hypothetical protein